MTKKNDIEMNKTGDTMKGAIAGHQFGMALGGAVDGVAQGAAQIVSVAGQTVLGSTGQLIGAAVGGGIEATKALFAPDTNKSIQELEAECDRDMARLRLKHKRAKLRRALKAQNKAEEQAQKARLLASKSQAQAAAAQAMASELDSDD